MNPTSGDEDPLSAAAGASACTTTVRLPARRPARMTDPNSALERRRTSAGITAGDPTRSGRQPLATLPPPAGQHRAAGTRTHAQPEAVRLVPAAIVGLKRTLAHFGQLQIKIVVRSSLAKTEGRSRDGSPREPRAHRRGEGTRQPPERSPTSKRYGPLGGIVKPAHTGSDGPSLWTTACWRTSGVVNVRRSAWFSTG